jgi:hypothetical protein
MAQEDKHTGIREPESPDSTFCESQLFPPPVFLCRNAVQPVPKLNPEGIGHPGAPPQVINLSQGAISRLRA